MKKGGTWGTVYNDTFGLAEANVACRAAGFGTAVSVTEKGSEYGRGIGLVHYQNVRYVHHKSHHYTYMQYYINL